MSEIDEATVARMAGNLLSGREARLRGDATLLEDDQLAVRWAEAMAEAIAREIVRRRAEGAKVNT